MARLQKIQQTINAKLPSVNSAFVKLRGLAIPIDVFLGGKVRFARKIGALLPVWMPDNAAVLTADVTSQQNKLLIDEPISWLVPGSKLRIANQVFAFVDDVVDDGYSILVDDLPINFYEGDNIELYAHPLELVADVAGSPEQPIKTVYLISDHRIYPGDELNVGSFNHVIQESHLHSTLDDGRYRYDITTLTGITSRLSAGRQDQVYLRAYPAYESQKLKTPTVPGRIAGNVGPFCYDRVSGPFFTDLVVPEIDILTAYDSTGSELFTKRVEKNELLYATAISPDSFLFWDRIRGKIQWDNKTAAFKAIPDERGVFHLHYKCIPPIIPGQIQYWRTRITPSVPTKMIVELEPNERQVIQLDAGRPTAVTIQLPSNYSPVERFHILFDTGNPTDPATGEPYTDQSILMRAWEVDSSAITAISHATIAKVSGRFLWGSSAAFAKPYWLRLDYLKSRADLTSLNAGLIAL